MEWRRRQGAGLLVLEAEIQNGDGRKLKWVNGKKGNVKLGIYT